MANPYANKVFLNAQWATLMQTPFTQPALSGATVTQVGTALTFVSGGPASSLPLGSYILITGKTAVAVVAVIDTLNYTVDLSQTVAAATAASITGYTVVVENAINTFLTTALSASNYYQVVAPVVAGLNAINAANTTVGYTNGKNGLRFLLSTDDGSVMFDSGKCTIVGVNNQITSLALDTYINATKKILISNSLSSSTNTITVKDVNNNDISLVLGTAGGNSINENHNTRPEIMSAIFNSTGIALSQRFSSTTNSLNYYLAVRAGISSEINLGTTRVNVPLIYIS